MRHFYFLHAVFGITLSVAAITSQAARQAQTLKAVSPNIAAQLCPQIAPPCDAAQTQLLQSASGTQYLLDASKPALIELNTISPRATVSKYMDLSRYTHSSKIDQQDDAELSIYPALYPLGVKDWAVAVVQSISWPYAGGGGSVKTADFLPFASQAGLADNALYRSVPFSCSEMIRACFSQREYDKSPHCHDENSGSLRIKYPDKPVGRQADWIFSWSEYNWPAHVAKSQATRSQKTFTLPAQFCEAP